MFKKLALAASVAVAVAMPNSAQAQLSSTPCATYAAAIFTNITPVGCTGFYFGNEIQGPIPSATVLPGLQSLGFVGTQYSDKLSGSGDYWGGSGQNVIDFPTTMYGTTIIGIHWGSGVFNPIAGNANGLGTAFFKFDAGSGIDKIFLSDTWKTSLSNAALFQTGTCTGNCVPDIKTVPEPSTYALMTAGLLGIFGVARRRRNAKV
jgi:hypothetical protein